MTSQYSRVLEVLETAGKPLALFEIKEAILKRFKRLDSEAGISARIRDIRHALEVQAVGTVESFRETTAAWYRYRVKRNAAKSNTVVTSA